MRVSDRYAQLVAAGELRPDPEQAAAAARLDRLQQELEHPVPAMSLVGRLFSRKAAPPPRAVSGAANRC